MQPSRPGIGLSFLLHALALCGVMRGVWHTPRYSPPARQAGIVWLAPPEPAPGPQPTEDRPPAAEAIVGSAGASRPEGAAGISERGLPPSRIRPSTPPIAPAPTRSATPSRRPPARTPPTASAPPAVAPHIAPVPDLLEARRRATVDVIEGAARADARRSFEYPGTIAQQRAFDESERLRRREHGLGPPLSVFDSEAKGRAGLPEEPMGPYGVHWVSDDCYVFSEPLDRFVLPGLFREPTTCTRRHARTDLFVTAKPSYLMDDEERAGVEAETQRRELLRRPTTGVIMPLAKD